MFVWTSGSQNSLVHTDFNVSVDEWTSVNVFTGSTASLIVFLDRFSKQSDGNNLDILDVLEHLYSTFLTVPSIELLV